MKNFQKFLPLIIVLLTAAYFAGKARPQHLKHPANLDALAATTVSYDGRLQPFDSLARNSLLVFGKRTEWTPDMLMWHQIKDYAKLAHEIVSQEKVDYSPGKKVLGLLTTSELTLFKTIAEGKGDASANLKMLGALNRVIDDVGRAVDNHLSNPQVPSERGPYETFYHEKFFAGVKLNDLEQDDLKKILAWVEHNTPVGDEKHRMPSRPMAIALNRKVLARSFPQYINADVVPRQPAIYWLADVVTDPQKSAAHRCFRIDHPRLREMLHLEKREGFTYSLDEVVELNHYLTLIGHELQQDREEVYQGNLGKLQHELWIMKEKGEKGDPFYGQVSSLWRDINTLMKLSRLEQPYWIPPAPNSASTEWKRFYDTVIPGGGIQFNNPHSQSLLDIIQAYRANDVEKFNKTLASYNETIAKQLPGDVARSRFETFYNRFDVFYLCTAMYVLAFLLVVLSWMLWNTTWGEPLRKSAFWMIVFVIVVHGFGLIARMYLMNRAFVFVTNLYSTAIFIGWIALVASLFLERYTKLGIGLAAATIVGVCTGIIAVNLRIDKGDTLELQQAVLDTNFWLATHVTAINIGYSATYLAGALAIVFILGGVLTRALNKDTRKILTQAMYGTICFATLFSFVGTVLGGIWADQSWGRFWGWDPKENGALMIVLWNVLILHARWGGMIQARGMAVLAVFGNIVTTWSYFGTNQLGVGLHAYGFMEQAVMWIIIFTASQLIIMAVGMIPMRHWRSFLPPREPSPSGLTGSGAPPSLPA